MSGVDGRVSRVLASVAAGLLLGLGFSGAASAAGPAKAGSTFITSYLNLPEGAIAGGDGGNGSTGVVASRLSADGRYVAFAARANTLSSAAHPDVVNIFRKDLNTGAVALISRATGGGGAGAVRNSSQPRISADGKLVAFVTSANLSPADVDAESDVYMRDPYTMKTTLATPDTTASIEDYDLSANGSFIAFTSTDVLAGTDTNGKSDVFRRNLTTGHVDLVSRIKTVEPPTAANDSSNFPSISGDGRWVAYCSNATDVYPGFVDGNGSGTDIFARDMSTTISYLFSNRFNDFDIGGNGSSDEPAIAGTPASVLDVQIAYTSRSTDVAAGDVDPSNAMSVYLRNANIQPSTLISQSTGGANADSRAHTPAVSDDANLVFFSSDADNLGAGADYYGAYVRDIGAGTTELGSANNSYAIAADVSGLGNMIVWGEPGGATIDSDPDAFGVFTRPFPGGPVRFASRPRGNKPFLLTGLEVDGPNRARRVISGNGRFVTFEGYSTRNATGNGFEVFRRDLKTGKLLIASRKSGASGELSDSSGEPSISNDGSRVVFTSWSSLAAADTDDKSDIYVRDFKTNKTILVSRADGPDGADTDSTNGDAAISGDGKRVVFQTASSNLGVAGGKSQLFVRDIAAGRTIFVSRATGEAGAAGNGDSVDPGINNNGRVVVFRSAATNLDPEDADGQADIYVRNLAGKTLVLASRLPGLAGAQSPSAELDPAISGDGKVVAFSSSNENLVPGSGPWGAFVMQVVARTLANGENSVVSSSAGGAVANTGGNSPSLNRDGSLIAFESQSDNLLAGVGSATRAAVFVKNLNTGTVSGPPAFGLIDNEPLQGSHAPSISDNGRCLTFVAVGHNRVSGNRSDISSSYVHVLSGTCWNPRGKPKPKLSDVSLKGVGKIRVKFRLNTKATVTARFQRKAGRRYVSAGKVVKRNQKAGKHTIRKKLKPGIYRVTLSAKNSVGRSNKTSVGIRVD